NPVEGADAGTCGQVDDECPVLVDGRPVPWVPLPGVLVVALGVGIDSELGGYLPGVGDGPGFQVGNVGFAVVFDYPVGGAGDLEVIDDSDLLDVQRAQRGGGRLVRFKVCNMFGGHTVGCFAFV